MSETFRLLQARLRSRSSDPFVTWYGKDGERAELSAATFATAVAKTTALLTDEYELEDGGILLDLPLHWQLPVWLAAADFSGMSAHVPGTAGTTDQHGITDAVCVCGSTTAALSHPASLRVVTSLTPFGLPGSPLPAGVVDHAREAMAQPDAFLATPRQGRVWYRDQWLSGAALTAVAHDAADLWGLRSRGRLLCDLPVTDPDSLLAAFAVPLVMDASVVLVQDGDSAAVAAAESVTATAAPTGE